MPFSPILSAFVCITLAAVFAACILFIKSNRHREALYAMLAGPAHQALAIFATATLGAALLSAVPVEHDGRTDSLLQITIESSGAGLSEKGASSPFAVADDQGRPLEHAGQKLPAETPPLIHIVKYTLIALIAGGVTSFTSILFTAAVIGARKGENLATGITMLSSFYWRPGMLTGAALWMCFTWLLLLWPNWHVLGTTAAGTDVMAIVASLLPWATCAAFWFLAFTYWPYWRNSVSRPNA